jgi:hypothetical protein
MKFIILSPVDHNGKRLQAGATIDMSKKDAAELLDAGAIAPYDAELAKAVEEAAAEGGQANEPLDPNEPPVPPQTEGDAA